MAPDERCRGLLLPRRSGFLHSSVDKAPVNFSFLHMPEAVIFIPLTQGKVAVIDFEDFDERVRPYKWCVLKSKNTFYARRRRGKADGPGTESIYLHRVITNCPDGLEPDHKNGDGLDNRKENLVLGDHAKNNRGFKRKRAGASSRFRGVCWDVSRQHWHACIRLNNHQYNLGRFSSEEDAARARDKKAIELGFAQEALNFPNI